MSPAEDRLMAAADGEGVLSRIARRKIWFLAGFLLTGAAVGGAFSVMPGTYRASAALVVAGNDAVLRSGNSADQQRQGDPADIESQMLMLRSPRLMSIILNDPKVQAALVADCEAARDSTWLTRLLLQAQKPRPCTDVVDDRQEGLTRLGAGFVIAPTGRSRVIEAAFVSPLAEAAVIVANALVDAYLADDKARKVDTHDEAIAWLNAEMARSSDGLRKAEMQVEDYRRDHGLIRGQTASIASERLSSLSQQLAAGQAAYAQAVARRQQFAAGGDQVREVLDSRSVSDLKQQAAMLDARYAELARRYGEHYPAVQEAAEQRRSVQALIGGESRRIGQSLVRDEQAAAARVAELTQQFNQLVREVGETGGAEAGIALLVRDVEARREIFVDQLKKVNALETERRLLSGDARLVNYAELPDRPWFPKRLPFVMVGMVLSVAVGAGIALLRDRADGTLRATSRIGGVPVLGYIPWVRQRRSNLSLAVSVGRPSPLQEAIRVLFGQCILLRGTPPRMLMIGSAEQGEGKTFLSIAMALFAASTGRKVLLLEADLRRPGVQRLLRVQPKAGLTEYLRGEAPFIDIVTPTRFRNLDVVTAGAPAIDSMELLSNPRFASLLRSARTIYALVLIDSPPSSLLMDARLIARQADGVVYCANFGVSRVDRIAEGIAGIEAAGGTVIGIAAGMVRDRELRHYEPAPPLLERPPASPTVTQPALS